MKCEFGSDMRNYDNAKSQGFPESLYPYNPESPAFPVLEQIYWSSVDAPLSVFKCHNDDICIGGLPGDLACGTAMMGQACARCRDKHYQAGDKCVECNWIEVSNLLFPTVPLLCTPLVLCILYFMFRDMPGKWGSWQNGMAALSFLVLHHYQLISLARSANLDFPEPIVSVFEVWGSSDDVISWFHMDCSGFSGFTTGFAVRVVFPLIVIPIFAITFGASRVANQYLPGVGMKPDWICNIYFSILFTFYPGIASMSMSLFKCSDNPNGKITLAADQTILCFEGDWNSNLGIAIAAILIYCVACLGLFIGIILIAPKRFHETSFQMRWKFLFIKYRPDVYWWSVLFLFKCIFINIGFIFLLDAVAQLYWMFFAILVYLTVTVMYLPWRHPEANALEIIVNGSILAVTSMCTWFADRNDELDSGMATFVAIFSFAPFLIYGSLALVLLYPQYLVTVQGKDPIADESVLMDITKVSQLLSALSMEELRSLLAVMDKTAQNTLIRSCSIVLSEFNMSRNQSSQVFRLTTGSLANVKSVAIIREKVNLQERISMIQDLQIKIADGTLNLASLQ